MLVKFTIADNGKKSVVPLHLVRMIVENEGGGCTIYTDLQAGTTNKKREFKTKETIEEIQSGINVQASR